MPYGDYDLCVVANGISSHCVNFCYGKPSTSCCHTRTVDPCCCHQEPCCCTEAVPTDPEVVDLRNQVKRLQNSIDRFSSIVGGEVGKGQPKDTKDKEEQEYKK
jgi:hypothetical protein